MNQEENIYAIKPEGLLSRTVKVASSSAATNEVIHRSRFIFMDDIPNSPKPPKMVSLMSCLDGLAILIWEISAEDGVYRWRTDVNITDKDLIRIEKKMKDGSSRRTDISIVF